MEQVNRLTHKTQTSTLCTGRKSYCRDYFQSHFLLFSSLSVYSPLGVVAWDLWKSTLLIKKEVACLNALARIWLLELKTNQISSNTVTIIIIQVTCTVNILQISKSLPTLRGYIRFNTLVCKFYFFERTNKFSKISLCSHLSRHHDDLRVGKTIKEAPLCLRVASRSVYYQF